MEDAVRPAPDAGMKTLASGFRNPVFDAQETFRKVMHAMAHPATVATFDVDVEAPDGLGSGLAALLLTLADSDTPVWLDAALAGDPAVLAFLKFHTGAPVTADPGGASLAFARRPADLPPLSAFAQGSAEYPDRSATIVTTVDSMRAAGWRFHGPGLARPVYWSASGLDDDFRAQWTANTGRFPRGVDLVFVSGREIAALPRSCRLVEG